jgi:hypothetical protein
MRLTSIRRSVVMELAPTKPPTAAAAESTIRMGWMSATYRPSCRTKSACLPTATTVPIVSKKSLMSSENTNRSSARGARTTCDDGHRCRSAGSVWNGAANALKSRPKFHVARQLRHAERDPDDGGHHDGDEQAAACTSMSREDDGEQESTPATRCTCGDLRSPRREHVGLRR